MQRLMIAWFSAFPPQARNYLWVQATFAIEFQPQRYQHPTYLVTKMKFGSCEIKRRIHVASIFPDSCLRPIFAILAECDEDGMTGKICLIMKTWFSNPDKSHGSFYRKSCITAASIGLHQLFERVNRTSWIWHMRCVAD